MQYPEFLKLRDTIGITAPSCGSKNEIDIAKLNFAKENILKLGYIVKETPDCRSQQYGRSANAQIRANELNSLFNDKNIKTIFGLTGGDFLVEMLSYINWETIKQNPKWIQGFSDMTGLTFLITTNCDIATIYGNNFRSFARNNMHKSIQDNLDLLSGKTLKEYSYDMYQKEWQEDVIGNEPYKLTERVEWINLHNETENTMNGRIIGGCLDVLINLIGTKFDKTKEFIEKYKNDGIIWYLDNCELNNEELVRAMWQFKEAGYFKYTKGIIFGRTAREESAYEISFKEAVRTSLDELNIPIILEADIGHKPPQMSIINGAIATIISKNKKGSIEFTLK